MLVTVIVDPRYLVIHVYAMKGLTVTVKVGVAAVTVDGLAVVLPATTMTGGGVTVDVMVATALTMLVTADAVTV